MTFPTKIYYKRFAAYKANFINLNETDLEHINCKYTSSKFLRIWSNLGYSNGRFWRIEEPDEETTEITEIHDISTVMQEIYNDWACLFEMLKSKPETMKQFQTAFKN
jgi:hypothetical protein